MSKRRGWLVPHSRPFPCGSPLKAGTPSATHPGSACSLCLGASREGGCAAPRSAQVTQQQRREVTSRHYVVGRYQGSGVFVRAGHTQLCSWACTSCISFPFTKVEFCLKNPQTPDWLSTLPCVTNPYSSDPRAPLLCSLCPLVPKGARRNQEKTHRPLWLGCLGCSLPFLPIRARFKCPSTWVPSVGLS